MPDSLTDLTDCLRTDAPRFPQARLFAAFIKITGACVLDEKQRGELLQAYGIVKDTRGNALNIPEPPAGEDAKNRSR